MKRPRPTKTHYLISNLALTASTYNSVQNESPKAMMLKQKHKLLDKSSDIYLDISQAECNLYVIDILTYLYLVMLLYTYIHTALYNRTKMFQSIYRNEIANFLRNYRRKFGSKLNCNLSSICEIYVQRNLY